MAAVLTVSDRAVRLGAFLSLAGRENWSWGIMDCTMLAADWVYSETSIDPAGPYRGAYTTEKECRRLIKRAGGFMPLIGMCMDECGFERTQSPQVGDVGLVTVPISLSDRMPVVGTISAICQGKLWAMRSLRGLVCEGVPVVTAWRI